MPIITNESPFEIIASPAQVYIAPVGTAFPVVNATPTGAWVDLGYTEGGITVSHTQNIENLMVDQLTIPVKTIRTEEGLTISFELAQLTLERYKYAINNPSVTTLAGPPATKEVNLYQGTSVKTLALLVRGPSPYGNWNMQYQVPTVIQTEEPAVTFNRGDKATLSVTFSALADLAAAEADRFGKLIAQSA